MNDHLRKPLRVGLYVVLGCVALPVLLILGLVLWYAVDAATGEDWPTVRPADMARRASDRSQELYDAAGIDRRLPAAHSDDLAEAGNRFGAESCYPQGIESISDTPEPGSYRLSHKWRLDGVDEKDATAALSGMHAHLKATGWTVTSYGPLDHIRELRARKGDEERVVLTWWSNRRTLDAFVGMPCAYDPAGAEAETAVEELTPPTLR
ncbi:hypothetical protein AB0D99_26810 [Streptomyces sp. NPDC047971]|uniref:hypothetical protein n=1 Tax=Streptomyces sp. NPDC047971 TaxID=3154499 RepID=UPI0033C8008C